MRVLTAVMVLVMTSSVYAGAKPSKASKAGKAKDKRFEAVVVPAERVVGSYRGPSESYGLVIEVADDGTLRGNYVEMGRVAVLNNIVLNGADFVAEASFDDGSSRTITGAFANRILNGTTAFGVRMDQVPIEGMGMVNTFFERF